jgi:hypothetical protein
MGAAASAGSSSDDARNAIEKILDEVESHMGSISDLSDHLTQEARHAVLLRLLAISTDVQDALGSRGAASRNGATDSSGADSEVGVRTRQKTTAEELIDDVEMEAAVDDEINTLLFEFSSIYGNGDDDVDEHVVSLFSREEFRADVLDSFGNSLVVKAVQEKNSAFLKLALNYGVDPNTPNSAGVTALHLVCYVASYDYDVADTLVSSGAQPALAVTSTGLTPLHYAVETRDPKLIKLLLESGASPTVQAVEDKTPLDYASMCQQDDIEHDGQPSEGIVEVIRLLKVAAANETEATKELDSQLHRVSRMRSKSVMKRRRRQSVSVSGGATQQLLEMTSAKAEETRAAQEAGGGGSGGMDADEMARLREENLRLRAEQAGAEVLKKQNEELQRQAAGLRDMKSKIRKGTATAKEKQELEEMRARMADMMNEHARAVKLEAELAEKAAVQEALEKQLADAKMAAQEVGAEAANAAALEAQVKALESQVADVSEKKDAATKELKKEQAQRKALYNEVEDLKGKIRVFARIRPLNGKEQKNGDSAAVTVTDPCSLTVATGSGNSTAFQFDSVMGPGTAQGEVFADTKRLVQSAIDGYNVCIFAYGQTGAGKSFTMLGEKDNPGVQPRAVNEIFRIIDRDHDRYRFTARFYMLELYRGKFIDLLAEGSQQEGAKITAKRNAKGVVEVAGATIKHVTNAKELQGLIDLGTKHRHVSATQMNAQSSRSHLIMAVMVESENLKTKVATLGKLSLVDLAGSESQKKTGATGDTLKEAQAINKSLSALGNVIHALTLKKGGGHVP